ncbi:MAG: hypothetical protein ACRCZE_02175 [Candidatus Altimarinota bacterium]
MKNKILTGVVLMGLASSSLVFAQPSGTPPNNNTPDATFNSVTVDATMITEDGELTNKSGVIGVKAILDVVANTGIKTAVGSFVNSGSGYGVFANAVDTAVYALTTGNNYAGFFRNSGIGPALYAFSSANVGVQAYGGGAGTGGRFSAASGNVAYLATPNNSVEVNGAIAPTVATNPLTIGGEWSGDFLNPSNAVMLTRPHVNTPVIADGATESYPPGMGDVASSFSTNCTNTGGESIDGITCRWPLMVNNGYSIVRQTATALESVLYITKTGRITNPSNQFGGVVNIDDNVAISGDLSVGGVQRLGGIESNSSVNPLELGAVGTLNGDKVKVLDDLIVESNDHGLLSTDLAKDADGWFTCPNGYYAIGVRVTSTNTVNGLRCAEL